MPRDSTLRAVLAEIDQLADLLPMPDLRFYKGEGRPSLLRPDDPGLQGSKLERGQEYTLQALHKNRGNFQRQLEILLLAALYDATPYGLGSGPSVEQVDLAMELRERVQDRWLTPWHPNCSGHVFIAPESDWPRAKDRLSGAPPTLPAAECRRAAWMGYLLLCQYDIMLPEADEPRPPPWPC